MIAIFFILFLVVLIIIGVLANRSGKKDEDDYLLANRSLNKYFIGLSAAATGNSGFIMTGAVGLGYSFGLTWLFLPLAWLIGDLFYWSYFPGKLNNISRQTNSRTISEILSQFSGKERKKSTIVISSFILFTILSAYTASQYIAASKTFNIFFNIDSNIGIILTALIIASYIILGGLRASVWTDILQIIVMAIVTLTMLLISFYDIGGIKNLITSLNNIDPNLLAPFSGMTLTSIIGFILGWSSAAFGFGLSQPQIIVRFFAGKSPEETQKAKWTYISFLQFTWIGMTLFGLIARALLNNVDDPESVLFVYVNNNFSSIVAAIILVGVFSAIASTIDSLVLASGNILSVDILKLFNNKISQKRIAHQLSSLLTIILTVILALYVQSSVFTLSAFAVSFLAATVGVSVLLKIFKPNVSVFTINTVLLVSGIFAIMWRLLGYHNFINEAFPSVIIGLLIGIISEKILIKAKVEVTT